MTRTAVLADIHGNADALTAVLDDIDRQGITHAVNLGDCFSAPLAAGRTWQMLRERNLPTVRGNHDRYLIGPDAGMGPSDRAALADLPPAALDWLRSLPVTQVHDGMLLCHATPGQDDRYWLETVSDGGLVLRDAAGIEAEAAGLSAGIFLCAHSHLPRLVTLADGRLVVNPGSVGCPAYVDDDPPEHVSETGSPAARYAVLEAGAGGWTVDFRALPYDPGPMAALARRHGREDWARALLTGRVR